MIPCTEDPTDSIQNSDSIHWVCEVLICIEHIAKPLFSVIILEILDNFLIKGFEFAY